MNKKCQKCDCILPLQDFYRHPATADRHLNKCKECAKEYARKHNKCLKVRKRDRERKRGKIQKSKPNTEQHNQASRRWTKKHPRKRKAIAKLNRALKAGKIRRSKRCEDCGKICIPQAHHFNYNKPLNVIWLCSKCHAKRHWK